MCAGSRARWPARSSTTPSSAGATPTTSGERRRCPASSRSTPRPSWATTRRTGRRRRALGASGTRADRARARRRVRAAPGGGGGGGRGAAVRGRRADRRASPPGRLLVPAVPRGRARAPGPGAWVRADGAGSRARRPRRRARLPGGHEPAQQEAVRAARLPPDGRAGRRRRAGHRCGRCGASRGPEARRREPGACRGDPAALGLPVPVLAQALRRPARPSSAYSGISQSGNQRSSSGSMGSSPPVWALRRSSRSVSRLCPPPAGTKG